VKIASLDKKLEYKKHYLQEAGKLIRKLGITSNELLNLSVNAESKGQQEYKFLLKDVVSLAKSKNVEIDNGLSKTISELEDAFNGLDDRNYNISIYIPFADKPKANPNVNNKGIDSNDDIFIFEGEDRSDIEYFEGYVLNEDGNYVSYEDLINEELAEELSEKGKNIIIIGLIDWNADGGGGPTSYPDKHFRFATMTIKTHKESWIAGASDIAMQMYKYENGALQKINFINEGNSAGGSHYYFTQFTRSQVSNQTQKSLYMAVAGMIKTDPAVFANSKFYYAIYETDNWPTTIRNVYFTLPNGASLVISFGSSDPEYYNSNANGNVFPLSSNQVNNNSEIKFTSYLQ
jgi:hypothetical protein